MKKILLRSAIIIFFSVFLIFTLVIGLAYFKQDKIVQEIIKTLNEDFVGKIAVKDSHLEPFAQFPDISIDLENLEIFEDKNETTAPIFQIKDTYVGFNIFDIISGNYSISSIKLKDGYIHAVQDSAGTINLVKAFESTKPIEETKADFKIDLKKIELERVDIYKLNESNGILLDLYADKIKSKFRSDEGHIFLDIETDCQFSLIKNNDTTFLHHKNLKLDTELDYDTENEKLILHSSEFGIDQAKVMIEGTLDIKNDLDLDFKISGTKPDFSLFMAMAPPELGEVLKKYDNEGKVYFDATLKGKIANGAQPLIEAKFGCEKGFFENTEVNKKLDDLHFNAYFTNGEKRNLSTMVFELNDFSARPEAGTFKGKLVVKNFESPEIDLNLNSDFELDFLAKFLDVKTLSDLQGKVVLDMNFRDIIDLQNPEKSLEKLNESYYTKLKVSNLSFKTSKYHLPIHEIDIDAVVEGKELTLNNLFLKVGKSDIKLTGMVSDLPAIIHHQPNQVLSQLNLSSKLIDIYELTSGDTLKVKPFNEKIEDFNMGFAFKCKANAFTESKHLPVGEFFIDNLYAKMKNYPHALHDFHADVFVTETDFKVIDFSGIIDKSDFHFSGNLTHYDLWMINQPNGDTKIQYSLSSSLLKLEDLFSYNGANYVPEDYRHEEFKSVKLKGHTDIYFKSGKIHSTDIYFDELTAFMKMHHLKLEQFKGRVHLENEHLLAENFKGKMGHSSFLLNIDYFLGKDEAEKKRSNYIYIDAPMLDMDELFSYESKKNEQKTEAHDTTFNIYTLPFTDLKFKAKIGELKYHRYHLKNFYAQVRTAPNHYLYVDTMSLEAADGKIHLNGYFNGSNPKKIYFSPNLTLEKIDLDKLMFKFENFGQDHLVSENLHGKVSAAITGKMLMYPDLTPKIDESDLHIEFEVLNGRLENFALLDAMSGYFGDKNLKKVLFDTLYNKLDFKNGQLSIPNMSINSSLGFIQISGKQDMSLNMDYYVRIPMKMVTQVAGNKLFGGKKKEEVDAEQIDEIQKAGDTDKIRFVNLHIKGTPSDMQFTLKKDPKLKKKGA